MEYYVYFPKYEVRLFRLYVSQKNWPLVRLDTNTIGLKKNTSVFRWVPWNRLFPGVIKQPVKAKIICRAQSGLLLYLIFSSINYPFSINSILSANYMFSNRLCDSKYGYVFHAYLGIYMYVIFLDPR